MQHTLLVTELCLQCKQLQKNSRAHLNSLLNIQMQLHLSTASALAIATASTH